MVGELISMISKHQVEYIVRKRNHSLSEIEVNERIDFLHRNIVNGEYDFSEYQCQLYTQNRKKRKIYSYTKLSCEDVICQYLKKKLDLVFSVKYASRNRIMNVLFNVLPVIKDMNDFVIVRADFKSFFDSVLIKHVYDKYIKKSILERSDKEMLESYVDTFKYCHAGLCLSNGMTEIICRDFDEHIKGKLSSFGLVFYERYVDDFLIIMNKYISREKVIDIVNSSIYEVFGNSPVRLSMVEEKFSYIAKRDIPLDQTYSRNISFLGYEFEIIGTPIRREEQIVNFRISFKYGISQGKRNRYRNILERAIKQYTEDHNTELLRHRVKIYSSRILIGKIVGSSTFDWITKGIVANYNELKYHINDLTEDTETFMKRLYFDLFNQHGEEIPYFLKQSLREESIYNLFSNMKRNRSIVFHDSIGVTRETLIKWIQKLEPRYSHQGKSYYHVVADYLKNIKIE